MAGISLLTAGVAATVVLVLELLAGLEVGALGLGLLGGGPPSGC